MIKTRLCVKQPRKTVAGSWTALFNVIITELLFCNIVLCILSLATGYLSHFILYLILSLCVLLPLWCYLEYGFTYKSDLALIINDKSELVYSFSELSLDKDWVRKFFVVKNVKSVKSFLGLNFITGNLCRYIGGKRKNCHVIVLPANIICKNLLLSQVSSVPNK